VWTQAAAISSAAPATANTTTVLSAIYAQAAARSPETFAVLATFVTTPIPAAGGIARRPAWFATPFDVADADLVGLRARGKETPQCRVTCSAGRREQPGAAARGRGSGATGRAVRSLALGLDGCRHRVARRPEDEDATVAPGGISTAPAGLRGTREDRALPLDDLDESVAERPEQRRGSLHVGEEQCRDPRGLHRGARGCRRR
jgi:hypothetical protein